MTNRMDTRTEEGEMDTVWGYCHYLEWLAGEVDDEEDEDMSERELERILSEEPSEARAEEAIDRFLREEAGNV